MKKILAFIVVLFLALLVSGCAILGAAVISQPDYTYEGDYDPAIFTEWTDAGSEQYYDDGFLYTLTFCENPDPESPISGILAVFCYLDSEWVLVSYGYNKYDIDYVYVLDIKSNRYKLWLEEPSTDNIHKI